MMRWLKIQQGQGDRHTVYDGRTETNNHKTGWREMFFIADGKETWNSEDYFSNYSSDPFKYIKDYEPPEAKKLREKRIDKRQNDKDIEQEES